MSFPDLFENNLIFLKLGVDIFEKSSIITFVRRGFV